MAAKGVPAEAPAAYSAATAREAAVAVRRVSAEAWVAPAEDEAGWAARAVASASA